MFPVILRFLRYGGLLQYGGVMKLLYTRWRRVIGCLKLLVNFRQRATDYRALLRKMTSEDEASYDSTPPCTMTAKLTFEGKSAVFVYSTFRLLLIADLWGCLPAIRKGKTTSYRIYMYMYKCIHLAINYVYTYMNICRYVAAPNFNPRRGFPLLQETFCVHVYI